MAKVVSGLVEVCLFRFVGDRSEYLLLKRRAEDPLYPGIWQTITGSLTEGETAINGALRELREETGLRPARFWVVPHTSAFYDHRDDTMHVVPLFAAQVGPGEEVTLSEEHEAFGWFPFTEARRRVVWPGQKEGLGIVESYILGGEEAARLTSVNL